MNEQVKELMKQAHEDLKDSLREHLSDAQIIKILPAIQLYGEGMLEAAAMHLKNSFSTR